MVVSELAGVGSESWTPADVGRRVNIVLSAWIVVCALVAGCFLCRGWIVSLCWSSVGGGGGWGVGQSWVRGFVTSSVLLVAE